MLICAIRIVLQSLVLIVELIPDYLSYGWLVSPPRKIISAVLFLPKLAQKFIEIKLNGFGHIRLELSLEDLVIPNKFANGDAILFDEIEIGGESASF